MEFIISATKERKIVWNWILNKECAEIGLEDGFVVVVVIFEMNRQ
ncbi:MAG: hypothetical protein ACJAWV_001992 [Flammeovirgaceae bacterium]